MIIAAVVCIMAIGAISYRAVNASAKPHRTVRTERATLAAGCFWGVEATFRRLDGVVLTTAGYSGGHLANPTYKDLCSGKSGHAETVQVEFDPTQISYAELLDAFWSCHDPTELNIAGAAEGEPQRSIIFVHDPEQRRVALASRDEVHASGAFRGRIRTEILLASPFYPAEEYHQQYLAKLGGERSCHVGPVEVRTKLAMAARPALRRGY
jgi:peptide-methionine (S)-S-oxide reductase